VDFKNTIIILTSNLGAEYLQQAALDTGRRAAGPGKMAKVGIKEEVRVMMMMMMMMMEEEVDDNGNDDDDDDARVIVNIVAAASGA
jgi:hypothetical protein